MKIDTSAMQVYTIDRPKSPVAQTQVKPAQVNQFSDSRFAELLSLEEKSFISSNFKIETAAKSQHSHLGRHLDVTA